MTPRQPPPHGTHPCPPGPAAPWDKVHMKPGRRLGGKRGHGAAVTPRTPLQLQAPSCPQPCPVSCLSLQVAIGLEAVVARVGHDNVAVGGERQPLWPVQRVSRRVDVGQERARAVKHLQDVHTAVPNGPTAQGPPALITPRPAGCTPCGRMWSRSLLGLFQLTQDPSQLLTGDPFPAHPSCFQLVQNSSQFLPVDPRPPKIISS